MILHLIQLNERNSYNLHKQFHELYDLSNHLFVVINRRRGLASFPKLAEFQDFRFLDDLGTNNFQVLLNLKKLMRNADHIVIHTLLFNKRRLYFAVLSLLTLYLHKTTWIEWGADLYNWFDSRKKPSSVAFNLLGRYVREHVSSVGLTCECDEVHFRKTFKSNAPVFYTPLPFDTNRIQLLEETRPSQPRSGALRVQIAHNALAINKHFSIIDKVKQFAEENVQFIFPLSYGSFGVNNMHGGTDYMNSIISCAKSTFEQKAIIMSQNLDLKHYLRYLWNIDVVVFHSERPIGLANIYYLAYMKKKIFIPSTSPQFAMLRNQGIPIEDTLRIPDMTFEEFAAPLPDDIPVSAYLINKFSPYKDVREWEKLFDYIGFPLRHLDE